MPLADGVGGAFVGKRGIGIARAIAFACGLAPIAAMPPTAAAMMFAVADMALAILAHAGLRLVGQARLTALDHVVIIAIAVLIPALRTIAILAFALMASMLRTELLLGRH